mmetsp:Transcript_1204/g.2173  ORF Transcript_1204/g.2173 Transcript_1204/m.2173 type:complete len:99 (-) Transcript_1204:162-458(-)
MILADGAAHHVLFSAAVFQILLHIRAALLRLFLFDHISVPPIWRLLRLDMHSECARSVRHDRLRQLPTLTKRTLSRIEDTSPRCRSRYDKRGIPEKTP